MMPVLFFWAFPAVIVVDCAGYYLVAIAEIIDAALALAIPTEMPLDRRRKFTVIDGGKTAQIRLENRC
jgi:hypothetical protein